MKKKIKNKFTVLGLMSGTSLDGLDIALCQFKRTKNGYTYKILKARTINYDGFWKEQLTKVTTEKAENYFKLNAAYGKFIAEQINKFLKSTEIKPIAIASHGHTVFHQPNFGFSTQLGCGATIAAITKITTVCDFRSLDVATGGQGAPLVPIGDKLLFGNYTACLNIGGIANISFNDKNGNRIAYDVCEANMLLNYLSQKIGLEYDKNGSNAKSGKVNALLLSKLNSIKYYSQFGAKSIGREWFGNNILPLIKNSKLETIDLLATATEHIAQVIAASVKDLNNVLVTGGGAHNSFLIERIKSHTSCKIKLPNKETINFKEALIFAFLGYLRLNEKINTLGSVTGAKFNSTGGAVYLNANNLE